MLAGTSVSASWDPRGGEAAPGATADMVEPPVEKQVDVPLLAARLEAVGVHDPQGMSAALEGLGLRTPGDLAVLDDRAVAELDTELREDGASLGDWAKLRIRAVGDGFSLQAAPAHGNFHGNGDTSTLPRRAQAAKEGGGNVEAEDGGGLSADTLALVSTAVLGIATFVLQTRAAKNAEVATRELENARVEHERERALAAVQLERVRSQMGDVYRPVQAMLNHADACAIYMQHELGFEFNDVVGFEFVLPFALWPRLAAYTRDYSPKMLAGIKGSPYKKYSAADIALLEDVAKRQLYIEAYTGCIAPRYREIAEILATTSALMENPPPSYLDGVYPAAGVSWTEFLGGSLSSPIFDMAAFAHAWAPLERRWEAGGAAAVMYSSAL
jgi:hypothetical protein